MPDSRHLRVAREQRRSHRVVLIDAKRMTWNARWLVDSDEPAVLVQHAQRQLRSRRRARRGLGLTDRDTIARAQQRTFARALAVDTHRAAPDELRERRAAQVR